MGFLQTVKNAINSNRSAEVIVEDQTVKTEKRGISELFAFLQKSNSNQEPDFLDNTNSQIFNSGSNQVIGLTDNSISPKDIFDMVYKDVYFSALFESMIAEVFKNDFFIKVAKDKDGNLLGSEKQAQILEDMLRRIDYEKLITQQLYGEWGDGGGNVLLFTVQGSKGIEFKVEPFLDSGKVRVKVYGDERYKEITKYEVVDVTTLRPVYTLDPEINYMYHSRYTHGGDFRLSGNPAKKAVFWYILKKYIAGSNLASFKNGLQDPVLMTPDYSALSDLVNAMGEKAAVNANDDEVNEYLRDPIKFLSKQSQLDEAILKTIVGNARRNNIFLKLKMPYKFQTIGKSNVDMQTLQLIKLCDTQMGYALKTSRGVISTEDSKYSNAEVESDNWNSLVLDPVKKKVEKILQEFYLPVLDTTYNPKIYKVCFGREPDAEDIEIYNAKTGRNKATAEILVQIKDVPGYKYNIHTNEIEEVDQENKDNDKSTIANDIAEETNTNSENVDDRAKKVLLAKLKASKKKRSNADLTIESLLSIYERGKLCANVDKSFKPEVFGFARVNAFLAGRNTGDIDIRKSNACGFSFNYGKIDLLEAYYLDVFGHRKNADTRQTPEERLEEAYEKYHANVNMSRSELERWSDNECSKKASLDRSPIRRNLELLDTKKKDWTTRHVSWALKTVGFISRMKKNLGGALDIKDSNGNSCGTKAHISLKNWGYDSGKKGKASNYKTKILRARKETPSELAIKTPEYKKFTSILEKAIKTQLDRYIVNVSKRKNIEDAIENLQKDMPSIATCGLPVNTLKQQELKFARIGVEEFDATTGTERQKRDGRDFEYPQEILDLMDAKAQLMVKGWDSLTQEQQDLMNDFFSREFKNYAGMGAELTSQVNTILNDFTQSPDKTIDDVVKGLKERITEIYKNQATKIANTEVSQAVESSRYRMYVEAGWEKKRWLTVHDHKVRDAHRDFEQQGWIDTTDSFYSGRTNRTAKSPASEIDCRCTVIYKQFDSKDKPKINKDYDKNKPTIEDSSNDKSQAQTIAELKEKNDYKGDTKTTPKGNIPKVGDTSQVEEI